MAILVVLKVFLYVNFGAYLRKTRIQISVTNITVVSIKAPVRALKGSTELLR